LMLIYCRCKQISYFFWLTDLVTSPSHRNEIARSVT
jgi:hypothetical protein